MRTESGLLFAVASSGHRSVADNGMQPSALHDERNVASRFTPRKADGLGTIASSLACGA